MSMLAVMILAATAFSQPTPYATGLNQPIGLAVDARGWLWVGEQGTGNNDGQISVVMPDGTVYPFVSGLPSEVFQGEILGPVRPFFDVNGELLVLQGEGTQPLSGNILEFDTSGFSPGDPPKTIADTIAAYPVRSYVLGQGFLESNPYDITLGPDDDWFISDAAANAIIRRDRVTGNYSVFATFPDFPNPLPFPPPFINVVPTNIEFMQDHFLVSSLTGFPFIEGAANIFSVDTNGAVSVYQDSLTTLVSLDVNPMDNSVVALKFAHFNPPPPPPAPGFVPFSGALLKVSGAAVDTLAAALNFPADVTIAANGNIFISSLGNNEILLLAPAPPDINAPSCELSGINPGPPVSIDIEVMDSESGVASVEVVKAKNASVEIPKGSGNFFGQGDLVSFSPASITPVLINAVKVDNSKGASVTLRITDEAGNAVVCDPVYTKLSSVTPESFQLVQNYPNPFNPTTTIHFNVPAIADNATAVEIIVYDLTGREVATLVDGVMSAGEYSVQWDGTSSNGKQVAGGVYIYRMVAGDFVQTRKMVLIK
ncbi:MAG: ScyD/ScyE family protein [Calditrichia bacterium]